MKPLSRKAESSILCPMFSRLGYAALAAFLVISGCGPSDSRKADISLKGKVGDTYRIDLNVHSTFLMPAQEKSPAINEELTMTQTKVFTCTKVEGTKTTWVSKSEKVTATGSGSMVSQAGSLEESQRDLVETVTRDAQNRAQNNSLPSAIEPVFPNRPVSLGDQWRGEANLQGVKSVMTYTFEKFEKVNGKETAVILSTPESPDIRVTKPMRIWIELEHGWPMKAEALLEIKNLDFTTIFSVSLARK